MIKILKYLIPTLLLVIVAGGVYLWHHNKNKESDVEIEKGHISDIKTMAQLCTIDIYSEVPVLDTINHKVIFAIQKQTGNISFDLENMLIDADGDTVRATLPPEIIDIYEATEDNSWQVVDTKNIGFLGAIRSNRLSMAEENQVKAKAKANAKQRLYQNGTVEKARIEAADILQTMMEKIYRKPVVIDNP